MAEHETTRCSAQQEVTLRDASAHDIEAIAARHADSWRRHYRGAYLDSFLDGDVVADRQAVWGERLTAPGTDQFTIVADCDGVVAGFVHMILDADPRWGALLDNLHVSHRLKRRGIGRRLLGEAARGLAWRRPADSRFYLWVLDQNRAAQSFYAACGGTDVETTLRGPFPGGGRALSHRMAWPDAAALAAVLARGG
ncbi:MAG TPA: GNAT family N-acetyltransferase [Chloroflexota bacterium]|nr:GNAT family N-acetyltransferase [Chloroflexota bacterium]